MRLVCCSSIVLLLTACGGGGHGGGSTLPPVSSAPLDITANVGDKAISLAWSPPNDTGGNSIRSYSVESTPAIAAANITTVGTRALIQNLTNGSAYRISVHAVTAAGIGLGSTPIVVTPHANSTAAYAPLVIQNDSSPSGIYDPSVLHAANGDLWLSYSSVDYHKNTSNQLVQDVGIRLAKSVDGGLTFNYVETIASPADTTVSDASKTACGSTTCTGRWVYETSWLIEDAADPDANRRFKLFAHKYFLYPPGTTHTLYHLGAIVMWTASSPDATWSSETALLGWNLTPPELIPLRNVNTIDPALADCIVVAEGSATVRNGVIDFVFACPYGSGNPLPQKIVMLRSVDHANTFQYVSTLLTPTDAAPLGANHFSAPALIATEDAAPMLLVTPVFNGLYSGCVVFPIADDTSGSLFRPGGVAAGISYTSPINGHIGGAGSYDSHLGARGILQSDATPGIDLVDTRFDIVSTNTILRN